MPKDDDMRRREARLRRERARLLRSAIERFKAVGKHAKHIGPLLRELRKLEAPDADG